MAVTALAAACGNGAPPPAPERVALFTSLPILWREAADIRDLLADDAAPHWALAAMGGPDRVQALDALADDAGAPAMASAGLLVMAQPRPLAPQENVALDAWVRGGGHLLLFADPLLTADSAYALGDKRRPQDVVLLSPILRRWGLALSFDEGQPAGEHVVAVGGAELPVNLPGSFALAPGTKGCATEAGGIVAACTIGKGTVLAIADAALLEDADGETAVLRAAVLRTIIARAAALR